MITYQREFFVAIMHELPLLFLEHYEDVALDKERMELDPAWGEYLKLEQQGLLFIFTVRHNKELIGYHFNVVHPHLHYKSVLCSFSDMFFLKKDYRKGFTGFTFFRKNEIMLRGLGVKKIFVMSKVHRDMTVLLKKLKYTLIEYIHSKWIGN
jgi:hypothetical protein